MRPKPNVRYLLCWVVALVVSVTAAAHQSPSHEIDRLTKLLETGGPNATLYLQRAYEHLAMGDHASAQRDLNQCLKLGQSGTAIYEALARTHLAMDQYDEAIDALDRGKYQATSAHERASLCAARAEVHVAMQNNETALSHIQSAINLGLYNIEWAILRSRLQHQLDLPHERIANLESAVASNPSIVLRHELLDAHIDANPSDELLEEVRLKCERLARNTTWKIRLARIYLHRDEREKAEQALTEALQDIEQRYRPEEPHFGLLAQRAEALAMLGKTDEARRDWQTLHESSSGSALAYYRIEQLLGK